MAISTDAAIAFFGTQDEVTTGTPGTIASGAFSVAGDVADWTNDDDAPLGAALLKCQFDTTMPTAGRIGLYGHLLDVQSTNDIATPDTNYEHILVGAFPIDFGVAADTDFYTAIPKFSIPMLEASQTIEWFLQNIGTGQTIGQSWQLWVTPWTWGPHA